MRNNPTRRDGVDYSRCQCGFSRKLNKWFRNGCRRHPAEALKPPTEADRQKLIGNIMAQFSVDDITEALQPGDGDSWTPTTKRVREGENERDNY